jgi:RimJ/RimL family protein N-acetyltransferase
MQQAGRNRGTGKPIIASALRAREIGRDPRPRKALWPAADVRRINRSNTWPHRPALQNHSNPSCQRRAVHTWRQFAVSPGAGYRHISDTTFADNSTVQPIWYTPTARYGRSTMLDTPRLRLRCWREADRDALAAMHADPEVMVDYGGPISRAASDAKLDRYAAAFHQYQICRWAVEDRAGALLGYTGIMPSRPEHPLGPHMEIGWRLVRRAWGYGYATEAAKAALADAFDRVGLKEVLAYTGPDNLRSQAVMARLRLQRDPARDFTAHNDGVSWRGFVWMARRADP